MVAFDFKKWRKATFFQNCHHWHIDKMVAYCIMPVDNFNNGETTMKWTQRMPDELFDQFKKIAENDGMSINAAFNRAVKMYISQDRSILEQRIDQLEAKLANTGVAATPSGGVTTASSVDAERFAELEKRIDFAENMARNTIRQGCVIGTQLDKLAEHVNFSFQEKAADEEYEEDDEADDESEDAS